MIWNYRELFIRGVWITIALTAVGYSAGVVIGLIFGLGRLSHRKWIYYPSKLFVDYFRGTALLAKILLIHFALIPSISGHSLGFCFSGALALMLLCGAYTAVCFT